MDRRNPPPYTVDSHPSYPHHPEKPPPPGFVAPTQYQNSNVAEQPVPIIQQINIPPPVLGPESQTMVCTSCHAYINTKIVNEASNKTHLNALLLCLCGCICCAFIPYCVDNCQTQKHYCPNCGSFLGAYKN